MTDAERLFVQVAACVPWAVLLVGRRRGLSFPLPFRIAAWGFLASVPADVVAGLLTGSDTWLVTHVYAAPQLALFALATGPGVREATGLLIWLAVAAAIGLVLNPLDRPEVMVTILGSVAVCYFALTTGTPLAPALLTYCGLGTLLYCGMVANLDDYDVFMRWWRAYQASRLTAFALFGRAAWKSTH